MKSTALAFALAFLLLSPGPSLARVTLTGVYVVGMDPMDTDVQCKLRREIANATVEGVIRSNKIALLSSTETEGQLTAKVYFNPLFTGPGCSVSFSIEFFIQGVTVYGSGTPFAGYISVCRRGGILAGPTAGLQKRLNEMLQDLTQVCISEAEKMGE